MLLPPPVNISKVSTTYKGMLVTIHFPGDLKTSLGIMAAGKGVNGAEAPCCPQTPLPIHLALWMVAFKGNFKPHLWFWTLEAPFMGHKAVSPVSMIIITYAAL